MKLGVAFSGGGVKGAAHIGVLKALRENNIKIDAVAGTSAGSIVATLYALGYTEDEMIKLFRYFAKGMLKANPGDVVTNVKNGKGLRLDGAFSSINVELAIKEVAKYKNISNINELSMPIAIPTVDINTSKKYVFTNHNQKEDYYIRNIEIAKAVRASCTYPGVFAPFDYGEYRFVDGGVLDNIPADEVKKLGVDKILTIKFVLNRNSKPRGIYGITMKCVDTIYEGLSREAIENSDYICDIDVSKANAFSIKKIDYCYEEGYKYAISKINEIRKMLQE
ncbi:MAG: hypothetical protein HFJ58_00550 [Clostridia bacterium]|nr:hypothetical protein [Clostridia bacterium]